VHAGQKHRDAAACLPLGGRARLAAEDVDFLVVFFFVEKAQINTCIYFGTIENHSMSHNTHKT
jgi:hypothetical protein